jgi:hypothetical protein
MSKPHISKALELLHETMHDALLPAALLSRQSFRDFVHVLAPSFPLPGRMTFAKEAHAKYLLKREQVRFRFLFALLL